MASGIPAPTIPLVPMNRIRARTCACFPPAPGPGGLSPEFGHNEAGRHPFRQGMAMTTVSAVNQIIDIEMGTYPHRHGFFAHIQVNKPRKPAFTVKFLYFQFKKLVEQPSGKKREAVPTSGPPELGST